MFVKSSSLAAAAMKLGAFSLVGLFPFSVSAQVVINEIAWMGTTTSANDEWIELYNTTDYAINIDGWHLRSEDSSPDVALQGAIPAGGYFLLERTNDESVPDIAANQIYVGSLANDGERLILTDALGVTQDDINASPGWPAGDAKTKQTMERNLNLAGWHTGPVNGTPRAKNTIASFVSSPTIKASATSASSKTGVKQRTVDTSSAPKTNLQRQDLLAGIGTNDPQQFSKKLDNNRGQSTFDLTSLVAAAVVLFTTIFGCIFIFKQSREHRSKSPRNE